MTTSKAKLEFVHAMARHTRATVRQCEALMRYAATLQRLAEEICNGCGGTMEQEEEFYASRSDKQARIQRKVTALCDEMAPSANGGKLFIGPETRLAYIPIFSSDPRGAVLKIRVPDGLTNDFGEEGICVPS